jgi:hypothetical protein
MTITTTFVTVLRRFKYLAEKVMYSNHYSDLKLTPPNITEAAKSTTLNLLPETSRKMYQRAYNLFLEWKANQNAKSFSENVVMAYFGDLATKLKSSTL